MPPLPLTAPHQISLTVVALRLSGFSKDPLLEDRRVKRVMDLLGDRLTVTVSPDGITVRGLLRTRHTPWTKMQQLTFLNRYDLVKGGLVARLADDIAGKILPIPVPGLAWLLRRIVGTVGNIYGRRALTPEEQEELRAGLGHALTDIERRGLDIELAGALRVLMFFSYGLSAAIEAEAAARGIKVVDITT